MTDTTILDPTGARDVLDLFPIRDPLPAALPARADSPELPSSLFRIPADVIEHVISTRTTTGNIVDRLPVTHHFSDGCYARELLIPTGTLATARRHLTHHLCVIATGQATIWEEGKDPVVYTAPCTFVGQAGARRIGYVHSDMVWINVWPLRDDERDPQVLFDRFTEHVQPSMSLDEIQNFLASMRDDLPLLLTEGL